MSASFIQYQRFVFALAGLGRVIAPAEPVPGRGAGTGADFFLVAISLSFFRWLFFLGSFTLNEGRCTKSLWSVKLFQSGDFFCVRVIVFHGPFLLADTEHLGIGIGWLGYLSSHKKSAALMWPVHHKAVNNVMLLSFVGFLVSTLRLFGFSRPV